jgi:hypothetical protein
MLERARENVDDFPGAHFAFLPEPPRKKKPTPTAAQWDLHQAVDKAREAVHMNGVWVFAVAFCFWCYSIRSAIKLKRVDFGFFPFSAMLVLNTMGVFAARANNSSVSDSRIVEQATMYLNGSIAITFLVLVNYVAAIVLNHGENGFRAFCVGSLLLWFSLGLKTRTLIVHWGTLAREKAGIGEPMDDEEGGCHVVDQYGFRVA